MFTKAVVLTAATLFTASMATTYPADLQNADTSGSVDVSASYDVADTRGMDNRQDRRDTRQDCRQAEGVGADKRQCKQNGRG